MNSYACYIGSSDKGSELDSEVHLQGFKVVKMGLQGPRGQSGRSESSSYWLRTQLELFRNKACDLQRSKLSVLQTLSIGISSLFAQFVGGGGGGGKFVQAGIRSLLDYQAELQDLCHIPELEE